MRINIYTEQFQLTSELRAYVDSRLLPALERFRDQIKSAVVRLRVTNGRTVSDTTISDVIVSLYPSGEVRARGQAARLDKAIDRAAKEIGVSVEKALSQSLPPSVSSRVIEKAVGPGALEVVLDGNRISQQQRKMLERPENYLRGVVVREYWRPSVVEHDERPEEREVAPDDHRIIQIWLDRNTGTVGLALPAFRELRPSRFLRNGIRAASPITTRRPAGTPEIKGPTPYALRGSTV